MEYAQTYPDAVYLSEDEASLYLQATTTAVWAPVSRTPIVRAHPQRDQVSFYGTLDLLSGQEVVTTAETMNAEATAIHLQQILATYPDKQVLLFWDRATWHQSKRLRKWIHSYNQAAKQTGQPRLLTFLLPKKSPWLNPIEPRWIHAKRKTCEPDGELSAPELRRRLAAHFDTEPFWHSQTI